jgi:hypothetical protein
MDSIPSASDISVLIINGCAVLRTGITSSGGMSPCDARWQKLLISKKGPLTAILSYRGTAPMDNMGAKKIGGNRIAEEMAQAMIDNLGTNWKAYARRWLEINAKYPITRTAAAIDTAGYWYINQKMEPASHTHEARPLPGFDENIPEGTIVGPGPAPI